MRFIQTEKLEKLSGKLENLRKIERLFFRGFFVDKWLPLVTYYNIIERI